MGSGRQIKYQLCGKCPCVFIRGLEHCGNVLVPVYVRLNLVSLIRPTYSGRGRGGGKGRGGGRGGGGQRGDRGRGGGQGYWELENVYTCVCVCLCQGVSNRVRLILAYRLTNRMTDVVMMRLG